ncbi:MAG: 4Fe-4S binding protein [Nitrospirota bacterium]
MKGRISIDRELCKGCNYCVLYCPQGVIETANEFNMSGCFPAEARYPDRCDGCTLCAVICPEIAIEVWRE